MGRSLNPVSKKSRARDVLAGLDHHLRDLDFQKDPEWVTREGQEGVNLVGDRIEVVVGQDPTTGQEIVQVYKLVLDRTVKRG